MNIHQIISEIYNHKLLNTEEEAVGVLKAHARSDLVIEKGFPIESSMRIRSQLNEKRGGDGKWIGPKEEHAQGFEMGRSQATWDWKEGHRG